MTASPLKDNSAETPYDQRWQIIRAVLAGASAAGWDGCHKIFIYTRGIADEETRIHEHRLEIPELLTDDDLDTALDVLHSWYENSCPLRMIHLVHPSAESTDELGFVTVIAQFEDED